MDDQQDSKASTKRTKYWIIIPRIIKIQSIAILCIQSNTWSTRFPDKYKKDKVLIKIIKKQSIAILYIYTI